MRSLHRHFREAALAMWISRHWSEEEALDTYGTLVYMGEGRRGLRSGALVYFRQPLESLAPGEAALLVALTRSPRGLNPACYPERAAAARNDLLARMVAASALEPFIAAHAAAAPVAVKLDCPRI